MGLDASLPDLIDAMSIAMQAVIDAANDSFDISSPSGVMEGIADNLMVTLSDRITRNAMMPMDAMASAMMGVSTTAMATTTAPLASNVTNRTANINFGNTNISSGIDLAVFESTIRRVVRSELGVAG